MLMAGVGQEGHMVNLKQKKKLLFEKKEKQHQVPVKNLKIKILKTMKY